MSPAEIANITIAALAFVATLLAAVSTIVSSQVLKRDENNKKHQWAAQLEGSYQNARKHNRDVRDAVLEGAATSTMDLAKKYYMTTTNRNMEMEQALKKIIGQAMDESATVWEIVVVQLQGGLLPANFFSEDQEWRIRAVKYLKEMEPLDVANWYRYNVPKPDVSGAGGNTIPKDKLYPPRRPRRYKILAEKLAERPNQGAAMKRSNVGEWLRRLLGYYPPVCPGPNTAELPPSPEELDQEFRNACGIIAVPSQQSAAVGAPEPLLEANQGTQSYLPAALSPRDLESVPYGAPPSHLRVRQG